MYDLRDMISDFSDEKLAEMHRQRGDYTDEAVKIIDDEVARRGLDVSAPVRARERTEAAIRAADAAVAGLGRDDFEALPHPFTKADVLTANSILFDSKVPYVIDKYDGDRFADDADMFVVLAYRDALAKALELIEEHFEPGPGGHYVLRRSDVSARLKAFSANDIRFSDRAAREPLEVDFSDSERAEIVKLAELLISEADRIEEERGRVVFFYDSLEALVEKFWGSGKDGAVTRVDFLAIIELCQIYCDDPRYNHRVMDGVAASILDFFV